MTSQTRTRRVRDDVSEDSAVESDISSLTDGDTGSESSEDGRSPPRSQCRRDSTRPRAGSRTPQSSFSAGTSTTTSREKRCSTKRDRMLMRDRLQTQADKQSIPNMFWFNKELAMIRIPWKHGSRSGWTIADSRLYRAWAEYTGMHTLSVMYRDSRLVKQRRVIIGAHEDGMV